ncbi:MAG: FMN-binding protein, partial [Lachnospiraceae bacterium]|nr:FMN-binding protein [Lachnospiraceae bacterium]
AGTITDVVITGDGESADIGKKYIDDGTFAGQIIEDQHYDIDGVSGATYTTYGVREAAEDALTQAEQ